MGVVHDLMSEEPLVGYLFPASLDHTYHVSISNLDQPSTHCLAHLHLVPIRPISVPLLDTGHSCISENNYCGSLPHSCCDDSDNLLSHQGSRPHCVLCGHGNCGSGNTAGTRNWRRHHTAGHPSIGYSRYFCWYTLHLGEVDCCRQIGVDLQNLWGRRHLEWHSYLIHFSCCFEIFTFAVSFRDLDLDQGLCITCTASCFRLSCCFYCSSTSYYYSAFSFNLYFNYGDIKFLNCWSL